MIARLDPTHSYIQFKSIEKLYEHWTVGDTNEKGIAISQTATNVNALDYNVDSGLSETDDYIMFVHGWRMQPWERRRFAEASFKRLHWSGYKGKFGFFSWPGEYVSEALVWAQPQNYNRSEAVARRSAQAFANLTVDLGSKYNLNVFAHSMGNYVVSEALKRYNTDIDTYIATQSATEAESYAPYVSPAMDVVRPLTAINDSVAGYFILNPDTFDDAWVHANSGGLAKMPPSLFNQTPTLALELANTPLPYYFDGIQSKTTFLNFYNSDDEALKAYEANQVTKPDSGSLLDPVWEYTKTAGSLGAAHHYWYDPFGPTRTEISWNDGAINSAADPTVAPDAADILSHIIPARSVALGAYIEAGGEIIPAVDMNLPDGLNFDIIHSAQFLSNYQTRKGYWDEILYSTDLKKRPVVNAQ